MENGDLELGDVNIIQETRSLLDRIRNKANEAKRFSPSIYMAPSVLRDLSPSSFNPRVVSIGPLHREDENVQAFEKQKATYLMSLMSRIPSLQAEEILESCMQKAYALMEQIKACYAWNKIYCDADIAEMMVSDACFILEFMHKIREFDEDSYSGKLFLAPFVAHDLVLLENQIPFFFLDEVFQCTILKNGCGISLIDLIYPVLSSLNPFKTDISIDNLSNNTTHHILSILHQCYTPKDNISSHFLTSTIHSAVHLDRTGVSFKPNKDPAWVLGMDVKLNRFPCFSWSWGKPTLRMPVLVVGDMTEMILRNLIAYEQTSQNYNHIISYALAMNMLVNTKEDVAKLVESRVLVNIMGSNEEAANMINNICKQLAWGGFFYEEQWKELNKYSNGYWPKQIARLRSIYFSSPWSIIALAAGIFLFALTVIQAVFTVKSTESKK